MQVLADRGWHSALDSGTIVREVRMFEGRSIVLTPNRIRTAYVVGVAADAVQLLLGPLGWFAADAIVDVAAMIATSRLLGFHPLLLPTFVLEAVPVADLLPTWTGCVALVVALRKRQHAPPPPGDGQVIDV